MPTQVWIHFSRPVGLIPRKLTVEKQPLLSGDCVKKQQQPRKASPIVTASPAFAPKGFHKIRNSVPREKTDRPVRNSIDHVVFAGLI